MSAAFILLAVLSYLSRSNCFKFSITRNLASTLELPENVWSHVELLGVDPSSPKDVITVTVDIPVALPYSHVFVFFANDAKEILGVKLNESVSGTFYEMPHKRMNETQAESTSTLEKVDFRQISGGFPRAWLPSNITKVSATIKTTDENYYNYYGMQNFELAIPDLMVVEEYKQLSP